MKATIVALALILAASNALAANFVTQAIFSIASTAKTSTANLRIAPMTPKSIGRSTDDREIMQSFLWQANSTQNLFLTKTKTVDLSMALCAWVQVDQATNVKVNSESPYMILPSGYNNVLCFK